MIVYVGNDLWQMIASREMCGPDYRHAVMRFCGGDVDCEAISEKRRQLNFEW
jgi:hypothetical protein